MEERQVTIAGDTYKLDSPFMVGTAAGLVSRGLCVARFNFPYMETRVREGSRRPPDRAPRLLDAWRRMLDVATRWRGHGPVVLAGKSMGGRMASMLLAEGRAPEVVGAVYLGYPLHPPGKPRPTNEHHVPEVEGSRRLSWPCPARSPPLPVQF